MSKKSDEAKIEFIIEMLENIDKIVSRHNGVVNALEDFEGQMAILMAVAQVGETLNKLDNEFLKKCDLLEDKEGAYYTRNYIVHNYDGVDLYLIEDLIKNYFPILKEKLLNNKPKGLKWKKQFYYFYYKDI